MPRPGQPGGGGHEGGMMTASPRFVGTGDPRAVIGRGMMEQSR